MKAGISAVSQYKHRLGKRKKTAKSIKGKVAIFDSSFISGFCVVVILIQTKPPLFKKGHLSPANHKHDLTLHNDEGRAQIPPFPNRQRSYKLCFPGDRNNFPVSLLKHVSVQLPVLLVF